MPFLTDEQVCVYENTASPEERGHAEAWFGVEEIYNSRPSNHVLSTSLFWKHPNPRKQDLPTPNLYLMQNAVRLGLDCRYDPWNHYLLPIMRGAERTAKVRPDVTVRVYLAQDLAFLIPELTQYCEVYLMRHSSLLHNPGAMWRFLVLEDALALATITDSDLMDRALETIGLSESLITAEVATWRVPMVSELDRHNVFIYRPMAANRFGTRQRLPVAQLAMAFVWHLTRGSFSRIVNYPGQGPVPHFGFVWPGYGIDEHFLARAIYPRLLPSGFIVKKHARGAGVFALDWELTKTANHHSRIVDY